MVVVTSGCVVLVVHSQWWYVVVVTSGCVVDVVVVVSQAGLLWPFSLSLPSLGCWSSQRLSWMVVVVLSPQLAGRSTDADAWAV